MVADEGGVKSFPAAVGVAHPYCVGDQHMIMDLRITARVVACREAAQINPPVGVATWARPRRPPRSHTRRSR